MMVPAHGRKGVHVLVLRQVLPSTSSDIETIIKHLPQVSANTLTVAPDSNPITDWGTVSTMNSSRRNTTPSKPPPNYSDVWHMDIGYGPFVGIGGIRYTLLLIDKSTRFKFIFGLTNLKDSLIKALQQFLNQCGVKPKVIRCDFDTKFLGKQVKKILDNKEIALQAAPPRCQTQLSRRPSSAARMTCSLPKRRCFGKACRRPSLHASCG